MDKSAQIRQKLKEMAGEAVQGSVILAQVKSVDVPGSTCDLFDEESGLEFYDVRLRPVLDELESITLVPKVNTWALAIRIEDSNDWMIVAVGEADKWRLKTGQSVLELNTSGLLLQKGDDTLKQLLQLIIEAIQVIVVVQGTNPDYAKLVQATEKLNNLLR